MMGSKNVREMNGKVLVLSDLGVENMKEKKGKPAVNKNDHDDKQQQKTSRGHSKVKT